MTTKKLEEKQKNSPYVRRVLNVQKLPLEQIVPNPNQPRKSILLRDEDSDPAQEALVQSIREHGLLQPILVTKEDNKYRIIAGERRYRAYKKLNEENICCYIISNKGLDGEKELKCSIEENLIREDLSPMETALALSEFRNISQDTPLSNAELAKYFGKSESYISEILSLTKLNSAIQDFLLVDKKIPMRKIKKIATIKEQEEQLAAFENLKEQYYPELQTENVMCEKKIPLKKKNKKKKFFSNMSSIIETMKKNESKIIENPEALSRLKELYISIEAILNAASKNASKKTSTRRRPS